jgi:hypothetical protein
MEKQIDIAKKYDSEIAEINYILQGLYDERIYGYKGNQSRMDGSLQHNIDELAKKLNKLMNKIEYGKESDSEELAKQLFIVSKEK